MPRATAPAFGRRAEHAPHRGDDGPVHTARPQCGGGELRQLGGHGGQEGVPVRRLQRHGSAADGFGDLGVHRRAEWCGRGERAR